MDNIQDWIKAWLSSSNRAVSNNAIAVHPRVSEKMKYFGLIERIRKGELYTIEDIEFIKTLSSKKLIVLLKLYNIQHSNLYRDHQTYDPKKMV